MGSIQIDVYMKEIDVKLMKKKMVHENKESYKPWL